MKTHIKHLSPLLALTAVFDLLPVGQATAQTFRTLHTFTTSQPNSSGVSTNGDGSYPWAGLILSGSTLYGTARFGGSSGSGTVFAINTNGTGFTVLHSFTAMDTNGANSDGSGPVASLILSNNTLYGTTYSGGSPGVGTVFALQTDGTGFTNLHSFDLFDPFPNGRLILSEERLYGTTAVVPFLPQLGGTVFALNIDGTGFTNMFN